MSKIILVDVDGTIVEPYYHWWRWMEIMCQVEKEYPVGDNISYNLSDYFYDELSMRGIDPMDFWRGDTLYDYLTPIKDSAEVLWKLSSEGYKIHYASHCKGNHMKSKVNFIKRNFPFDAFYATQEKGGLKCDIVIDDRHSFLNQIDNNVIKILYNTPFTQGAELLDQPVVINSWKEIEILFGRTDSEAV